MSPNQGTALSMAELQLAIIPYGPADAYVHQKLSQT